MMRLFTASALALLVAAPAFAQPSNRRPLRNAGPQNVFTNHFRAYNQLQSGESGGREQAIRDCNDQGRRYSQYLWGNMEIEVYRSCMAARRLRE
jgi:hypothetical protein